MSFSRMTPVIARAARWIIASPAECPCRSFSALRAVDVHQKERCLIAVALRTHRFTFDEAVPAATIVETGQLVGERFGLGAFDAPHEFFGGDLLAEQRAEHARARREQVRV